MSDRADASPTGPPLVALLGRAHDAFVCEFDEHLARSEFPDLSLAHSRNVLRHLQRAPARASHLVELCGVSKQAVSQQLTHPQARGYVQLDPDPSDGRARLVILTDKGRRAQRFVHDLFARVEDEWSRRLGAQDHAELRRILRVVVTQSGSECR